MALASTPAEAEPPLDPESIARAEALFQTGTDLLEAGDLAAACPKLEAAVELTRGEALGGKLVLARCYEADGRTASALGLFREVDARARAAGQIERADNAAERAQALAAHVHFVKITLALHALPDGARVTIDGKAIPRPAWTTPIPIDPGVREVALDADGFVPTVRRVEIPPIRGTTEILFDAPLARRAPTSARASHLAAPHGIPPAEGSFWSAQRTAGLVTWVAGGLGSTAGLVLGGVAIARYDDGRVTGRCVGSPPACEDPEPLHEARSLGDASTVTFFVGLGVSAVGVVLFATAGNEDPPVSVGVSTSGLSLTVPL